MKQTMPEQTYPRQIAQLGFLEQYLTEAGWPVQLVEPGEFVPVPVLLVGAPHDELDRPRSINFAYVPVGDDLTTLDLLQFYAPLPFRCEPACRATLESLLITLNFQLPIGHFGLTDDGEIGLRHVYLGHAARLIEQDEFMEAVALFTAMQDLFSHVIEAAAIGRISLTDAITALEAQDSTAPILISPPSSLLQSVCDFFEANEWPYQKSDDTTLTAAYQGVNDTFLCLVHTREAQQQLMVYSLSPVDAPESQRPAMAEFVTRANQGLFVGNFELDYADGEVRCKTSLSVQGALLTPTLIRELITPNLLLMDKYLPGIKAVADGTLTSQAAIALVEG